MSRKFSLDTSKRFTPRVNDSGAALGRVFSAGQIAQAVGVSARSVRSSLACVKPAGTVVRSGNTAPGFKVDQLPDTIKTKIEQQQLSLNYRSPEAVIANPKPQWQPTIPLSQQSADAVEYAHTLRRVLSFFIAHRNDCSLRPGELARRLVSDYESAFTKRISPRRAARLASHVLLRDGGREEFDRIELYLPAADVRAKTGDAPDLELPALVEAVNVIHDIAALTVADRGCIWRAALSDFQILLESGIPHPRAKRKIVSYILGRVPRFSETRHALRVAFDRKLDAFQAQGISGLCDKRRERARKIIPYTGPESLSPDERLLLERANSVGGGISQAFRELHVGLEILRGQILQFSEDFRATYPFNPRVNKSQVPHSLRAKLRPLLKAVEPLNHGPKAARLAAPSIHRDWSSVAAGAYFQSDDMTSNSYLWIQQEDGEYEYQGMRFDVLRPQILPMVDVRSDLVLSVLLIPRRQYNSRDIRSLILRTCLDERIGLPFDGFYFEGNIWQAKNLHALVNWTEIDEAFANSGIKLRVRHATTPKAKIIERIFSQEQNVMQSLPGYAGRSELTDGYERVKASLALMKRAGQPRKEEVAPWDHFLSADRYLDELQRCYERFNAEPQTGKRLNGLSPAEAWEKLSGGRPHHVVPDSLRYLLATEQSEQKVTREGVRIPGRPAPHYFLSDRLGELIGEKVIVRWNSEIPGHVVVVHPGSDPLGQSPFVVREDRPIPALDASNEDFSTARQTRKEFTQPGRSLFRMLNHGYGRTVRDELLGNFALRLAGEAHEEAVSAEVEAKPTREATAARARKIATRVGMDPHKLQRPDRAEELETIPDLAAELRQLEAEKNL